MPFRQRLIAFGQRLYQFSTLLIPFGQGLYHLATAYTIYMVYLYVTLRHFTQCLLYEWINAYSIWATLVVCEHRLYDLGYYFFKIEERILWMIQNVKNS